MKNKIKLYKFIIVLILILFTAGNANAIPDENLEGALSKNKTFTITEIKGNYKRLAIKFTKDICTHTKEKKNFSNNLKFFPPVSFYSWNITLSEKTLLLKSRKFKPGKSYSIVLPEDFKNCYGETYVKTVSKFTMPDITPSIELSEAGNIIEKNSRQMLNTRIVNVSELVYQGIKIPPILVPAAIELLKMQSFDRIFNALNSKNKELQNGFKGKKGYEFLFGEIKKEKQLFFTGNKKNKKDNFSIPLSFRQDKEKGAVELVQMAGNEGEKKVSGPLKLLRITDIALTYKISQNSVLIWATSLNSGKPVKNLSIAGAIGKDSIALFGKTDKNGILFIKDNEKYDRISLIDFSRKSTSEKFVEKIDIIFGVEKNDYSYIRINKNGNIKADWVNQAYPKPGETEKVLKGHIFTDRGIYRPGETVKFKGTVREAMDGDVFSPEKKEVTFEIVNSRDESVYKTTKVLSEFGSANDEFLVKPFFSLGRYTINMKFSEGDNGKASRTFQVQEFRAPRHFARINCKEKKKKDESFINLKRELHLLNCEISGSYYAGGPVKHGRVRWKYYYRGTKFSIDEYPGYSFGNYLESKRDILESGESMLDEKGKLSVSIPMSKLVYSGVYGIKISASVIDFDGRAASETEIFQKKPDYLVGISNHSNEIDAGNSEILNIIVLNKKGKKVKTGKITADVMHERYMYIKKRNDNGDVYWDFEKNLQKEYSAELLLKKRKAEFNFDFARGGLYLVKFSYRDKSGKQYSSGTEYTVRGNFYGYEYENRKRKVNKLVMVPEKTVYSPGETINIHISPGKKPENVLMTVEQDHIIEYKMLEIPPGSSTIRIPVEKSFVPNIYISLLGVTKRGDFPMYNGEFDEYAPSFFFGVTNIEIKNNFRKLTISLNDGEKNMKARPGDQVKLKISIKDNFDKGVKAELAIGVVDESVLALTGFETPTLDTLLKFNRPLSVFTGEMRAELLKQTPFRYVKASRLTGGGGLSKRADAVNSKIRKDFDPTAYFNPSVYTDKNGIARVSFNMPDTMTSYRVYIVAADKGSMFGSFQESIVVVKDFYIEPGIPKFFTAGDRFKIPVSSFNKTDTKGDITFSLQHDNMLTLSSKKEPFRIMPNDTTIIPVYGEALTSGSANITFSARFNEYSDSVKVNIPVNSGITIKDDVVYGIIEGNKKVTYTFPESTKDIDWGKLADKDIKAVLTISGSPFLRMSQAIRYLLKYPYGCVEQTSSGVLPLAALRGLIKDDLIQDITISEADKFLKKGIDRLFSMQTGSGGFGYWPGSLHPHKWGTIYASTALSYAKYAGFELPQKNMEKVMNYLKNELKTNKDKNFDGFAKYILAMNSSLDNNILEESYVNINSLPVESAMLILLSAKLGNSLPDEKLTSFYIKKALYIDTESKSNDSFYTPYRKYAISTLSGIKILGEDNALVTYYVEKLINGLNVSGRWTSTSDTGWALLALGEYYKNTVLKNSTPVNISLNGSGFLDKTLTMNPKEYRTITLDAKKFINYKEINIKTDSSSKLIYKLALTYPRTDYAEKGYSNGFRIYKEIINTDGTKIIKIGDIVKVRLEIDVEDDYRYVVIDDPLPAGLVAINSAIKTEEHIEEDNKSSDDISWYYRDSETGLYKFVPNYFEIKDDRVLIFKDYSWEGKYQYSYYARAVSEGEFIVPSTKIQLMYKPDIVAYTPRDKLKVQGR